MDPGGAKKFLYKGPKQQGEEEEEQWTFTPKAHVRSAGVPVDLNDVWSIQKNVSLGGLAPRAAERLTHNAGQGFYSRHGGIKDAGKNAKPPEKTDVTSAWVPSQGRSFSYSYTANPTANDDSSSIASSRVSRGYHSNPSQRRFDNHGRPIDENDF
ncbi:uncharacterized protein C11orf97 homolog isoform X2 [Littorina saxatilis]|uniref:Uncharacterized protein n=1 Tax=Littorina saxatilis TaxID=31220 RepID=A0AAN9GGW2_9CAEN